LLFWVTPGALWVVGLSLNPDMHKRLPDGRGQIQLDAERLNRQFAASQVKGQAALKTAGLSQADVRRAGKQAQSNLIH